MRHFRTSDALPNDCVVRARRLGDKTVSDKTVFENIEFCSAMTRIGRRFALQIFP
jgi:hypothetical protein